MFPAVQAQISLLQTVLRLADEFGKQVPAVKEASGNLQQVMAIIKDKPETFKVISGDDAITLPLIALGAEGVISVIANAYPGEFSNMVRLALDFNLSEARKIHYSLIPVIDLLFAEGSPSGLKAFLAAMGIAENNLRLPLVPVSES